MRDDHFKVQLYNLSLFGAWTYLSALINCIISSFKLQMNKMQTVCKILYWLSHFLSNGHHIWQPIFAKSSGH